MEALGVDMVIQKGFLQVSSYQNEGILNIGGGECYNPRQLGAMNLAWAYQELCTCRMHNVGEM